MKEGKEKVEECESLEVEKLPESIFWGSFGCDVANSFGDMTKKGFLSNSYHQQLCVTKHFLIKHSCNVSELTEPEHITSAAEEFQLGCQCF